jgi:putative ABC transport system ATP-binding protein
MIDAAALRFRWPGSREDCLAIDSLHIGAGRSVFLHGPSGSGKSTLLGLLAGVLLPRQGHISLLGRDWAVAVRRAARCLPRRPCGLHLPAVQPAALPERARQRAAALPLLRAAPAACRSRRRHGAASAEALLERVALGAALWARRRRSCRWASSSVWPRRAR